MTSGRNDESARAPDRTFATRLATASRPGPGRAEAFIALVAPLLTPLRRYLRAHVGDEADDCVNEVLLAAFEHLDRFRGDRARLRSWVFTIAHNLVVDRHRRRRPTVPLDVVVTTPARDDTEAEALGRIGETRLREALRTLPPGQRSVLHLRLVADLSIEQTAVALGRSPGAVKALQHRAIEAARARLVEPGRHPPVPPAGRSGEPS